jgi:hypothetical protein
VDCNAAQSAVSLRMDGERLVPRREAHLESHLETCERCARFADRAWRVRESVRFQVAGTVPDLVEPIMARVAEEARARRRGFLGLRRLRQPKRHGALRRELPRLTAGLAVGVVAGATVVGTGLWSGGDRSGQATASAAEVSRQVARAASEIGTYHATYLVSESHFRPDVALREFTVDVWFSEPERFRLEVKDHTNYPKGSWPQNDLTIIVNGSRWYSQGSMPCPPDAFPDCPLPADVVRNFDDRPPFAGSTPILTDSILPVTTLADSERLTVRGPSEVVGRTALRVELAYRDASPMFAFLQQGGSWRPFFPEDRVVLWLDQRTWLPLQYRVFPSPDPERRDWALRFALEPEPAGRAIFSATTLSVDRREPDPALFAIPAGPADSQGARSVTLDRAVELVGREPTLPEDTAGLDLYRVVVPTPGPGQPSDQVLLGFSRGLSWLKVQETRAWEGTTPFGPVAAHAERVELAGGGVAFYQPSTGTFGRRVSIHGDGIDLYLETNLSREDLLKVAASLPVMGSDLPESWTAKTSAKGTSASERITVERAVTEAGFRVALPSRLPAGYRLVSAELVRVGPERGLNVYFQGAEIGTQEGIRLHMEPAAGSDLPPVSGAAQYAVEIRGVAGRWTPDRGTLEWIEGGVYHSLSAEGLGLQDLVAVALSMEPAEAPDLTSEAPGTAAGEER